MCLREGACVTPVGIEMVFLIFREALLSKNGKPEPFV